MGGRDPFSDPVINFDRYRFNDKARGYLKDYLWGPKSVGYNARLSQAHDINAMAKGFTPSQVYRALWAKKRMNYLAKAAPKKQDKKPAQKPAVKGGLGSQKKKAAPAKELKKIVSKKPVKPPKEIRRQTVFQPRGTRKRARNPFTGDRPTL